MSQKSTRIVPLSLDQVPEADIAPFGGRNDPRCELNLFKVLIQHPDLFKIYAPFAMQLGQASILPLRDKEILILRTSVLCNEGYELAHHLYIARQAGMTDAEIEAAKTGGAGLAPFEQTLVKAAEELVSDHCVSNETWAKLAERYTIPQLIETVFMVGNYALVAKITSSLGIYPEEDVENAWKPDQKA